MGPSEARDRATWWGAPAVTELHRSPETAGLTLAPGTPERAQRARAARARGRAEPGEGAPFPRPPALNPLP